VSPKRRLLSIGTEGCALPGYVLRYGAAETGSAEAGIGFIDAETIGLEAIQRVQFGFKGSGVQGREDDRKSCHFQFAITASGADPRPQELTGQAPGDER